MLTSTLVGSHYGEINFCHILFSLVLVCFIVTASKSALRYIKLSSVVVYWQFRIEIGLKISVNNENNIDTLVLKMGMQLNCYEKYLTQVRRPTKVRCLNASKQPVGPTNTYGT